jgi:membrane protein
MPLSKIAKRTVSEWMAHDNPQMAAALAYYAVFSIAPLLMIAIGVSGFVFGRQAAQGQVMTELQGLIGADGARAIEQMLKHAAARPGSNLLASVVGIVTLLVGASGVMAQLQFSMNRIWDVPSATSGGLARVVRDRFLSFTMVLGVGFLLLVSLLASAAVAALGTYMGDRLPFGEAVMHALNLAISFGVVTFLFALIFRYVPDTRVAWRDVWLGAALTSLLFTLGKFAIGLYLGKGSIQSSYGAAGSLVVLLVWVYYSSQILFLGAELTHVIATRRDLVAEVQRPHRRKGRGRRMEDQATAAAPPMLH